MTELQQFNRVVDELQGRFPGLRIQVELDPHPALSASADIPAQTGLDFGFSFNLQGDELHLNVGASFWVEWFPCLEDAVTDDFIEAVTGILSGRYRIVEYLIADGAVKAELQRPRDNGQWERVATSASLRTLIPWPRRQHVIQNTGRGPSAVQRGA